MHDFKYKAVQYDVSRGRVPKIETVADRIKWLKPYGLNMLCLYMESVVATKTLPAVGCGKTPVTAGYLKKLKKICKENGVLLTPIIQILGHQEKLLALKKYEWMGELPPPRNKNGTNNFRIDSARVRETLFEWLDEILPLFHKPFVHVGCDEVWALGSGRSRKIVEKLGFEKAVAGYLLEFNDFLRSRGRQMAIWADLVISHPKLLDLLPKDIIISNWGYGTYNEAYENDNRHFAAQKNLASHGHTQWVCGNNHAEYIFPAFQRMNQNTAIWQRLAHRFGAEGFLVTDWGTHVNINPHVLSALGDQFVLMKLDRGKLAIDEFTAAFTKCVVGRANVKFQSALKTMLMAQQNPRYWPARARYFACQFGNMMLNDPAGSGCLARRFGAFTREGLERFLKDMRSAHKLMTAAKVKNPARQDYYDDLFMLANRLLMIALRLMLWYEHAWDTGGPAPGRAARIRAFFKEYLERSDSDLKWYGKRWREENLESEWHECEKALKDAQDAIRRIFKTNC